MSKFKISEVELHNLKEKVTIITGGSSGIGLATAELLDSLGAIVIIADRNAPGEGELRAGVFYVKTDVTSWTSLLEMFAIVHELHGRVDILFANAGVGPLENYLSMNVDGFGKPLEPSHQVLQINLTGCINTVLIGIHYMKKQERGGSIIISASASSYQRFASSDYATAKHGILGFMRSLRDQLHPKLPIRINAIAPSWTDTALVPKEAVLKIGVAVQPARVVAMSVGLLAVDERRHGQTIRSSNGVYSEIEEPILEATADILDEEVLEGEVMMRLAEMNASSA